MLETGAGKRRVPADRGRPGYYWLNDFESREDRSPADGCNPYRVEDDADFWRGGLENRFTEYCPSQHA